MKILNIENRVQLNEILNSKKIYIRENKLKYIKDLEYGECILIKYKKDTFKFRIENFKYLIIYKNSRHEIKKSCDLKKINLRNGVIEIRLLEVKELYDR